MSDREFEAYLALLCRMLRLDARQREAIARELRDHLEERLAELESRGVAHDEAVRRTLEEFGDAAALAAEFSFISRNVRRRWIMRMTLGSTLVALAVTMAVMALWPDGKQPGPAPSAALAQEESPPNPFGEEPAPPQPAEAAEPLAKRIDADFVDTPLADALKFLGDAVQAQIYVNRRQFAEAGITADTPVTLRLKNVRAQMLLDLILDQVDEGLEYVARDGVVIVSTVEDLERATEVRVYNVRDLLKLPALTKDAMGTEMMPAMGGAYPGAEMDFGAEGYGDYGGAGFGPSAPPSRAERLVEVLRTAIAPDSWQELGGPGTLAEYNGLIVVNHNARVHAQVEQLLKMLRQAAAAGDEPAVVPAPGGGGFF